MDFLNVDNIYVFIVKKSIAGIPIEAQCLSDLENSSRFPILFYEVL